MSQHFAQFTVAALGMLLLAGCSGEVKPRSVKEIDAERQTLPGLFMTPSGKQIKAPGNQGVFVDPSSHELAWPVYECTNPACPGRGADGQPHLFIWTDPRFFVADDGSLGTREFKTIQEWREAVAAAGGHREPTCDKCLAIRQPASESPEESQRYSEYPRRYVLPETAQRKEELDAEHQARIEYIKARTQGEL